jgi:hypothetical protein
VQKAPSIEEALALAPLSPRGRVQRAVQLSEYERRAHNAEQTRAARARAKAMNANCEELMSDLARYDLPLVQLLMAEFALRSCNVGSAGQMRLRFLAAYSISIRRDRARLNLEY